MNIDVIGAGGIGGWLLQGLVRFIQKGDQIMVWDGDKVTESNLDRQLFTPKDVGSFKTTAWSRKLRDFPIAWKPQYLSGPTRAGIKTDLILVCADNHTARLEALAWADEVNAFCIIGANGTIDAEAYIYKPEWRGTVKDPRVYYPELFGPDIYDPVHPACTGEAQIYTPQLVVANQLAAAYMLWLYHLHVIAGQTMSTEIHPYRVNNTISRMWATRVKEISPDAVQIQTEVPAGIA